MLVASEGLPPIRLHSQGDDFFKQTFFLKRGDVNQKQGVAPLGYLQVLMRSPDAEKHWSVTPPPGSRTSFRRTALADWITDPDYGAGQIVARVIVNRLWQHHLGHGIVATPNDFGARGERALASRAARLAGRRADPARLAAQADSAADPHQCRLFAGFRKFDPAKAAVDPGNRLFWRHEKRRLEGEVVRDALLACGKILDERMYGPGTLDETQRRRSIYFTVKRSKLVPMMQVFDAPEALSSIGNRPSTTIAPQALLLLNNPNVRNCARAFARRLVPLWSQSPEAALRRDT